VSALNAKFTYRTDIESWIAKGEKNLNKVRINNRADTQVRPYGKPIAASGDFFNSPDKGGQGGFFRRGKPMTEKQEEPCWKRQERESRERIKQKIARESGRYCIEAPNIIDKLGRLAYIR